MRYSAVLRSLLQMTYETRSVEWHARKWLASRLHEEFASNGTPSTATVPASGLPVIFVNPLCVRLGFVKKLPTFVEAHFAAVLHNEFQD
ncbi:MAG: hypothetical protein MAG451_00092 [Anaerolineales bacterium]|nr:hypothetical protein [Anaerolineales bacterium]